jgi:hypothetical protein
MLQGLARLALLLPVILLGCASTPEPAEEVSHHEYKHTFDFLWDEVKAELDNERYRVETEDKAAHTVTTTWLERLHPMSHFGERTRLTIKIEGDEVEGFTVKASEEAEENTEEITPGVSEEADWSPKTSDGARARVFLTALHQRLNPSQRWRESQVR